MTTPYTRTALEINADKLQNEINNNITFTATCVGVSFTPPDELVLDFNIDLNGDELNMMDTIIAAHDVGTIEVSAAALPLSEMDHTKISVHPSYKPVNESGKQTYAIWSGCGDDMLGGIGNGPLAVFDFSMGSPTPSEIIVDVKFDPAHGKVWIHEGYLAFDGAGCGDYVYADTIAPASQMQPFANLVAYLDGDWVKPAGTGSPINVPTHGFAATPFLIPRSYSKDGEWDFDGTNLTPNYTNTGGYKISTVEQPVNRFINRIPCCGTSPYFSMTSDETTLLPAGYFIRITAVDVSRKQWTAAVLMELYRERTYLP